MNRDKMQTSVEGIWERRRRVYRPWDDQDVDLWSIYAVHTANYSSTCTQGGPINTVHTAHVHRVVQ